AWATSGCETSHPRRSPLWHSTVISLQLVHVCHA
ncbi:hypothetical protein HaLaN_22465, partial [Haematococcus lacustris]